MAQRARLRRVGQDDKDKCQRKEIWEKCSAGSHLEKLAIDGKIMDAAIKYRYSLRKPWGLFSNAVRHGAGLTRQVHRDLELGARYGLSKGMLSSCCERFAAIVNATRA